LFVNDQPDRELWEALRWLKRGSGVLVLIDLGTADRRRLMQIARRRQLTIAQDGQADRVHDLNELTRAMLRRSPLILLSPLYPTRSHPDWRPLPRMRAATLARLGRRKLVALGGMDARRYARVRTLGFQGWAGISAFRT
jgi:thiamine-phosphate pyrophosphorylase